MAAATFMTDIVELATQAAEAAAVIGSLYSSFKVVEQAKDYYDLYRAQKDFYQATFRDGAEVPLAADVFGAARKTVDFDAATGELYNTTGVFSAEMGDISGWWARHSAMYGFTQMPSILQDEFSQDTILLRSHWANTMYRFEEANTDILNDQRWDHRMKLHNAGVQQQSTVLSGLASAESQREGALSATGDYLAGIGNSLAERRGLIAGHKEAQAFYANIGNRDAAAATPRPSSAVTFALGDSQPAQRTSATPGVFEYVR